MVGRVAAFANVLLLADGRFPAGGHAHSGGLEAAVVRGRVHDLASLRAFLLGRLVTAGLVGAAFAAATCFRSSTVDYSLAELDDALDARTPSPALRRASRAQGRSLCRAARAIWPSEAVLAASARPGGVSHPVALGVVGAAAGLSPEETATVMVYSTVSGSASAAVRLLGLDPYRVHGLLAALGETCDATAAQALRFARGPVADLPAASAPLLDVSAEDHAGWEVRLFAS
jgi:urease accessory protein